MALTTRLTPSPFESLFSFMVRAAAKNFTTVMRLWNSCAVTKHTFSLHDAYRLMYCPEKSINMKKFSELMGLSVKSLLAMSFSNILKKFKTTDVSRARLMSGLLSNDYRYCQDCLREKPHHSLLWSLNDIHFCNRHHTPLLKKCVCCGETIQLIEVEDFTRCPRCGGSLRTKKDSGLCDSSDIDEKQKWLLTSYEFLFTDNDAYVDSDDLALKLLFLLNNREPIFDKKVVVSSLRENKSKFPTLLQYARGTLKREHVLELPFLLDTLYKNSHSFEELFNTNVPTEFSQSIREKRVPRKDKLSCIAPWCSHYGSPRSLSITSAGIKRLKSSDDLRYYLICNECGCLYAIDSDDNLVERTKRIKLYMLLKTVNGQSISLKALSRISDFTVDEILRTVAYFDSRHIFSFKNYHIECDDKVLATFLKAFHAKEGIKYIQYWNTWNSQYEFLFYRYHQEVLRAEIADGRAKPNKPLLDRNKILSECIKPILEDMLRDDEDITVRNVSQKARICDATLKNWGGLPLVSSAKEKQKQLRWNRKKSAIHKAFQLYLDNHNGMRIKSEDVYGHLGILQPVLWRKAPELTAYIYEQMKEHNRLASLYN